MALEIRRLKTAPAGLVADRRLYLTRDESRVVEEGSAGAAFLFATPGTVISAVDADRLGLSLVDGRIVLPGAEVEEEPPVPPVTPPPAPPAPVDPPPAPPVGDEPLKPAAGEPPPSGPPADEPKSGRRGKGNG